MTCGSNLEWKACGVNSKEVRGGESWAQITSAAAKLLS